MTEILLHIAIMAIVTYLVRMLPMVIFRNKIKNRFIRSFLYYMPYAVLAAMTFPAVFWSTDSIPSAVAGVVVALVLALFEKGLVTVAVSACVAVFITEVIIKFI